MRRHSGVSTTSSGLSAAQQLHRVPTSSSGSHAVAVVSTRNNIVQPKLTQRGSLVSGPRGSLSSGTGVNTTPASSSTTGASSAADLSQRVKPVIATGLMDRLRRSALHAGRGPGLPTTNSLVGSGLSAVSHEPASVVQINPSLRRPSPQVPATLSNKRPNSGILQNPQESTTATSAHVSAAHGPMSAPRIGPVTSPSGDSSSSWSNVRSRPLIAPSGAPTEIAPRSASGSALNIISSLAGTLPNAPLRPSLVNIPNFTAGPPSPSPPQQQRRPPSGLPPPNGSIPNETTTAHPYRPPTPNSRTHDRSSIHLSTRENSDSVSTTQPSLVLPSPSSQDRAPHRIATPSQPRTSTPQDSAESLPTVASPSQERQGPTYQRLSNPSPLQGLTTRQSQASQVTVPAQFTPSHTDQGVARLSILARPANSSSSSSTSADASSSSSQAPARTASGPAQPQSSSSGATTPRAPANAQGSNPRLVTPLRRASIDVNDAGTTQAQLPARSHADFDNDAISPDHQPAPRSSFRPPSASSFLAGESARLPVAPAAVSRPAPHMGPFVPPESLQRLARASQSSQQTAQPLQTVRRDQPPADLYSFFAGQARAHSQPPSYGSTSNRYPSMGNDDSDDSAEIFSSDLSDHDGDDDDDDEEKAISSQSRGPSTSTTNGDPSSSESKSSYPGAPRMSAGILRALRDLVNDDSTPQQDRFREHNDRVQQEERAGQALIELSERAREHAAVAARLEQMERQLVELVERRSLLDDHAPGVDLIQDIERARECQRLDLELRRAQRTLDLLQLEAQISSVALMRAQIAALESGGANRGLRPGAIQGGQNGGPRASFAQRTAMALAALDSSDANSASRPPQPRDAQPHFGLVSDREGTQMIAMLIPPLLLSAASAALADPNSMDFSAVTAPFQAGVKALAYALGERALRRACRSAALMRDREDSIADFVAVDPDTGALRDPRPFPMGDRLMRVRTNDFVVPLVLPGGNVVSGIDISHRLVARAERAIAPGTVLRTEDHEAAEAALERDAPAERRQLIESSKWLLNDLWALWQLTRALGSVNGPGNRQTELSNERGSLSLFQTAPRVQGLSQEEIQRLPRWKSKKAYPADDPCCICLDPVNVGDEVTVLVHCHHHFHSKCSDDWWKRSSQCPMCKRHALTGASAPANESSEPQPGRNATAANANSVSVGGSQASTRGSSYRPGSYQENSYVDENGELVIHV